MIVTLWRHFSENPLLPLGNQGGWDEMYAAWGSIVRVGVDEWRLYYTGRDRAGKMRIGMAQSRDGLRWSKYQGNPIVDVGLPGSWSSLYVYCPMVWKEDDRWLMLFTGNDDMVREHYQVGLGESRDGLKWTISASPVFCDPGPESRNRSGRQETEGWGLLRDGTGYYLLYNTVSRKPREVRVAHSRDLTSWKSIRSSPLLGSSGFPWNLGFMKYCAWPFMRRGKLYVVAAVSDVWYRKSRLGLWQMSSITQAEPPEFLGYVLQPSSPWCEKEVDTPIVVDAEEEPKLRCYFGGRSKLNNWSEGLAFVDLEALQ